MPRILFVVADPEFFLSHRLPLARAARARGWEVHVATPHGPRADVIAAEFSWHRTVLHRASRNMLRELLSAPDLARIYRRIRPDLVHHIAIKPVLYGTAAARLARVPAVVNSITGLGYAFAEERSRSLLRRALAAAFRLMLRHRRMKFIFQHAHDEEVFLRTGWAQNGATVVIPGSGVDPEQFSPPATRPGPGAPLVVFSSRLLYSKGVEDFVEAARLLRAEGIGARFAIVGLPDVLSPDGLAQATFESWRGDPAVELWGHRADMASVFREASLFCLPTYYREGIPKVLLEAASSGVPSIASDIPGCREIVLHGETGLLVPPRDPRALSAAIRRLLADPELRERMGAAARAAVLRRFAVDSIVRQTVEVYEEMLKK